MICNHVSDSQLEDFTSFLMDAMSIKFSNHWYEDFPSRGQAFRAVCVEGKRVDDLVLYAANRAGISDITSIIEASNYHNIIMWVDPMIVEVELHAVGSKSENEIIYSANCTSFEPTQPHNYNMYASYPMGQELYYQPHHAIHMY